MDGKLAASLVLCLVLSACSSLGERYIPGNPTHEAIRKQQYPKCPRFTYPEYSVLNHQQGVTTLDLVVGEDGKVLEAALSESSGHKQLDEETLKRVYTCDFEKLTEENRPVKYRTKFKFHWELWVS